MAEVGRREVALSRPIAASRDRVFEAWTEPERLRLWWGPTGFTCPVCELEAREGGLIRIVMRKPGGAEHALRGAFRELTPPKRLAFTSLIEDRRGDPLLESATRVDFTEVDGGVMLRLQTSAAGLSPAAPPMLARLERAWMESLDRLAGSVGEDRCL